MRKKLPSHHKRSAVRVRLRIARPIEPPYERRSINHTKVGEDVAAVAGGLLYLRLHTSSLNQRISACRRFRVFDNFSEWRRPMDQVLGYSMPSLSRKPGRRNTRSRKALADPGRRTVMQSRC